MATLASVMTELQRNASEKTRAMYIKHGAPAEHTLGVNVADLKIIAKSIKKQQALAMEVYATGVFDAMYLAGMVANGAAMSKKELQAWAEGASGSMIFEYTVPWVAVENALGRQMAVAWIASKKENVAAAGWCTYAGLVATLPDGALDLKEIEGLLKVVAEKIRTAPNRVRVTMNKFALTVGMYCLPLVKQAKACAAKIEGVEVDFGDTSCKLISPTEAIAKAEAMGRAGVKRKTIRC